MRMGAVEDGVGVDGVSSAGIWGPEVASVSTAFPDSGPPQFSDGGTGVLFVKQGFTNTTSLDIQIVEVSDEIFNWVIQRRT
jgi:hypothetical protein